VSTLARYRKGIITALGTALLVLDPMQYVVHGDAYQWVRLAIGVATAALTVLVPNDRPPQPQVIWPDRITSTTGNTTVYRQRPDVQHLDEPPQ
jgi:hypothetical protein